MNLRKADNDDLIFLFELRNEQVVRENSFNTYPIGLDQHMAWFANRVSSPDCLLFIAENDGKKIGQIRYELDGPDNEALVSLAIVPDERGKGFGADVLRAGCEHVLREKGPTRFVAYIKSVNISSIKTFKKVGFKDAGAEYYQGQQCLKMIMATAGEKIVKLPGSCPDLP